MNKEFLHKTLLQNQKTCHYTFSKVTQENTTLRLNSKAASIGFIYRHIGEIMNVLGQFLGVKTDVQNTTLGYTDEGQDYPLEESNTLIAKGYEMLASVIKTETHWEEVLEVPLLGKITKMQLFIHILFHNCYHAGQIQGKRTIKTLKTLSIHSFLSRS